MWGKKENSWVPDKIATSMEYWPSPPNPALEILQVRNLLIGTEIYQTLTQKKPRETLSVTGVFEIPVHVPMFGMWGNSKG